MDYDKLADAITERTKVIVPVDIAGICADVDKVREIVSRPEILAKFHPANDIQKLLGRIAISNDCAHSFGASRRGKMAGEIADFSSFSFHAVKNFTTAEGGALTWNLPFGNEKVERQQVYCGSPVPFIEGESWNEFIYRLSQLFSLHGQNKDALAKTKLGAWEYDIIGPWYKCNMTDIMAALGLVQFERYPSMLEKRHEMVSLYNAGIDSLNAGLDAAHQVKYLNHRAPDHCSSHHLYLVRLQGRTREEANKVIEQMAERGIATNVHYKPLPMMTAYKAHGFDITDFPNAKTSAMEGVIATPHLGASTEESEDNCAVMAADELKDYLENGNIKNSVNYPACDMGICQVAGRIGLLHANIPNMIGQITSILAAEGINIANMTNKSRDKYAYTLLDLEDPAKAEAVAHLEKINGMYKVRVIKG